jgi:hypothetical protein
MKKNWFRLSILGVLVFMTTFVIRFPAEKLVELIQKNALPGIHWQTVSGTVFDARIEGVTLSLQNNRRLYVENLKISTSFPALLIGQIQSNLNISGQDVFIDGKIKLGINSWSVNKLSGEINIENLYTIIPELELLEASGDLNISAQSLTGDYHALPRKGFVTLIINGLQLGVISGRQSLGSYTLTLSTNEQEAYSVEIDTLYDSSLLFIEGDGHYTPVDKSITFKGQGWVSENTPENVKAILPLMGEVKNGRVLIDWQQTM